jgi:hypothetical protein
MVQAIAGCNRATAVREGWQIGKPLSDLSSCPPQLGELQLKRPSFGLGEVALAGQGAAAAQLVQNPVSLVGVVRHGVFRLG